MAGRDLPGGMRDSMAISDNNQTHLQVLGELLHATEPKTIPWWLLGGWGIDALLGRVTREHRDIDLVVELQCRNRFKQVVGALADRVVFDRPTMLRFLRRGVKVDVRYAQTMPDGMWVLDLEEDDRLVYPLPPDSFPPQANGRLANLSCRAVSWAAQYVAKAGFRAFRDVPLRDKDLADLAIIEGRLSVAEKTEAKQYFPGVPRSQPPT